MTRNPIHGSRKCQMTSLYHHPQKKGGKSMGELKPGWQIKGTYNESCASQGHCPYYFGRPRDGGCRYFMVFRIQDGKVNDVDLSGITVIYQGDLPHANFQEVLERGSNGGVYVSDNATPEQRKVLDTFVVSSLGALLMKKNFGVKYVDIEIQDDGEAVYFKMPFGEMKQELTRGNDGTPVRLENQTLPFITNVKAAHTPYWNYEDHGRHFDYRDRCGTWAEFEMSG
jgi:hypothetical protein